MKNRLALSLLALAGLLSASPFAQAAVPKTDARAAALVAALQAVSPDPLGGRLGLAASLAGENSAVANSSRNKTARSASAQVDQRAYASWKSSSKL